MIDELNEERPEERRGHSIPYAIVKYDGRYALVHGMHRNQYATNDSIRECVALAICWKNRGMCTSGDIDRLFINNMIEFDGMNKPVETFPQFLKRILKNVTNNRENRIETETSASS